MSRTDGDEGVLGEFPLELINGGDLLPVHLPRVLVPVQLRPELHPVEGLLLLLLPGLGIGLVLLLLRQDPHGGEGERRTQAGTGEKRRKSRGPGRGPGP